MYSTQNFHLYLTVMVTVEQQSQQLRRFISKGILTLLLLMVYWSWGSTVDMSSVNRLQDDRSVLKTLLLYYYNGAWTMSHVYTAIILIIVLSIVTVV